MSPPIAIEARNLLKEYRIYRRPADVLWELVSRRPRHQRHRALDDVSFAIRRGEVVGIIGRNGAGKSTLLKVLTGVLDHEGGTVAIRGDVSAILELGVGLNPEYSGRENILFGCVCRGMSLREAEAKFDQIVAFAELEEVIDRPFKTYSSGMQGRLLFATSIHVDAEILIIDEALAAGDILFQEKCLRRMKELAAGERTVLFVSHSLPLVQQLCTRAILLHHGRIVCDGDTATVTRAYDGLLADERSRSTSGIEEVSQSVPLSETDPLDGPRIESLLIRDAEGRETTILHSGAAYEVALVCRSDRAVENVIAGFSISLPTGLVLYMVQNTVQGVPVGIPADGLVELRWRFVNRLQSGYYFLSGGVGEVLDASNGLYPAPFRITELLTHAVTFQTISASTFSGVFDLQPELSVVQSASRSRVDQPAILAIS